MKFQYSVLGVLFSLAVLRNKVDGQVYNWTILCVAYPCGPKDYLDFCCLQDWCFCMDLSINETTGKVDYGHWLSCLNAVCPYIPPTTETTEEIQS
ncbi:UNVERIFIED_CONTAM: hypothetical protein RMT77_001004 [Armadillidium vulgare]